MPSRAPRRRFAPLLLASVVLLSGRATAQTLLVEDFDDVGMRDPAAGGPARLAAEGWAFSDQNTVLGGRSWEDGDDTLLEPHASAGFLGTWTQEVSVGGAVSKWVVLPDVPGVTAGTMLQLFVNPGLGSDELVAFEVRRSATGGTDTGAGPEDVGDFEELLWSADPLPRGAWLPVEVVLPGPGRIGLRVRVDWRDPWQSASYVGVDSLVIGEPPDDGCNDPPIPRPGETVTWDAASSPWRICADTPIPAGAAVTVAPGATVLFDPGVRLTVEGTLELAGDPDRRVVFDSEAPTPGDPSLSSVLVLGGRLAARHALWRAAVSVTGGEFLLDGCELVDGSGAWASERVAPVFVSVTDTRVADVPFDVELAQAVVRGTSFERTEPVFDRGYLLLDEVTSRASPGAGLDVVRSDQGLLVDRLMVLDARDAALELRADLPGNVFAVGPEVVLAGSAAPILLGGAGLTRESVVPSTGNLRDVLLFDSQRGSPGPVTWWDHGVPYVVEDTLAAAGGLTLRPGVRVLLGPDAALRLRGSSFDPPRVRGTAERPVVFSRLDPSQPWRHLSANGDGPRFEHAVVEGSTAGLSAPGGVLHVDSTTFRDNELGLHVSGLGAIRVGQSRFEDNAVGAETDPSLLSVSGGLHLDGVPNPNSFVGNGVAVAARADQSPSALRNWWGAVNGPLAPLNPDGTGDVVTGGVLVSPFLSVPPDFSDAPPSVELREPFFVAEPGTSVLVEWQVSDDVAVVSQRIVFSAEGNFSFPEVVVDDLGPDVRSHAWTIPEVGLRTSGSRSFIRVVATDSAGREGWDERPLVLPHADSPAGVTLVEGPSPLHAPGDLVPLCWAVDPDGPFATGFEAHAFTALTRHPLRRGTGGVGHCLIQPLRLPWASTNVARVAVRSVGGCCNGEHWTFSDCFSIRPDARIGDAPPTVELVSPADGAVAVGGGVVPFRWSAADDEALRAFHLQASFDGGVTWHEIVSDLPGEARSYDWRLAEGAAAVDLRVRVVAIDHRFQETASSCAGAAVVIEEPCAGSDADGDGYGAADDPDCPAALVDCNDADARSWATPGEAGLLFFESTKEHLRWTGPEDPGGTRVAHDVLRSRVAGDFVTEATCLEVDDASDTVAEDPERPGLTRPHWSAFHYLVRARNGCLVTPTGPLGTRSDGTPREGRACP